MGTIPTAAPVSLPPWPADRQPVTPTWTVSELLSARCVSIGEMGRTAGISWQAVWRAAHGHPTSMPTRRRIAAALAVETDAIRWDEASAGAGRPRSKRTASQAAARRAAADR